MDELSASLMARQLVGDVNETSLPVNERSYTAHLGVRVRIDSHLGADEAGWSFKAPNGKYHVVVNGNDSIARQRFTICHELGHHVLGLPSDHAEKSPNGFSRRSVNEMLCDVFAAELLLPAKLLKPIVDKADLSLRQIDKYAEKFITSMIATGSRAAAVAKAPCAFVLASKGRVRYASRSTALREERGWISPQSDLPGGSLAERLRRGLKYDGPEEIDSSVWFKNWDREGILLEDARHLSQWDQTVALLCFEDEMVPRKLFPDGSSNESDDSEGLSELDGKLPWPGKRR